MLTGKLTVDRDRRYTVKETAKVLGIGRSTLDKYAKRGDIVPIMHKPTGALFYEGTEIERFWNCTI